MGKKLILILIVCIVAIGSFVFIKNEPLASNTVVKKQMSANTFSYTGKNGVDALSLLQKSAAVEQGNSGLVVAINGKRADDGKHEYWAFYVNGKLAQVGPTEYKTKDTDTIEWKIEKY